MILDGLVILVEHVLHVIFVSPAQIVLRGLALSIPCGQ